MLGRRRQILSTPSGLVSFLLVALASCSSISGKKLIPCPDGSVRLQDVGGLPIVVKTPNRAVFILTESVYSVQRIDVDARGVVLPAVALADEVQATISPEPILLGPSEVYTIDPLRPASGSLDYGITLSADQYPTSVNGKISDTTITDVGAIVEQLMAKLAPAPVVQPQSGTNIVKALKQQKVRLVIVDLNTGAVEVKESSAR